MNELEARSKMKELGIPELQVDSLSAYLFHGMQPGSGLTGLLAGDLFQTVARCDNKVLSALRPICVFLQNYAPPISFGDSDKVDSWLAAPQDWRDRNLAERTL